MGFNCGIIGLPNVGKSTIFNALTGAGAQMANYPFCTIEPNKGIVPVPDEKLMMIAKLLNKSGPIPTRIEFTDVAGLVKGASKGEGLGNKFLGHIRTVDAIVHVVRCFSVTDIIHVTGEINPVSDIETINTELMLADMEILERASEKLIKLERSGDKAAAKKNQSILKALEQLNNGNMLITAALHEDDKSALDEYGLITAKPVLYLGNTAEGDSAGDMIKAVTDYAEKNSSQAVFISGKIEEEISELPLAEKKEFLTAMGLEESGLDRLIRSAYSLLGLITYYTSATELQAWTLKKGTTAPKAAGKIHTDFERGFIRAEVFPSDDLIKLGSEHKLREAGLLSSEGKEYIINDGDVVKFLFNV